MVLSKAEPEAGDYRIWGRVLAPTRVDDSLFVAVDDSEFVRWNTERGEQWTWDLANAYQADDPVTYHLTPGMHTLYIMQREDGTAVDKFIVTKDSQFNPE